MIRVEHPEFLLLLLGLAIVAGVYGWFFYWRKKALLQFGEHHLLQNILIDYSRVKSVTRFIITVITFILIVFGLTNVQMGSSYKKMSHSGIDIALLIDVSNSMLATDAVPDRLNVARQMAKQLVDLFPDSRIAIVSFAGSSSTLLPLTPDHAAAHMVLESLSTTSTESQGTDLASGLNEAMRALPANQNRYRAIVIFSDGEHQEHDVNTALRQAVHKDIVISALAIGSEEGSEIPLGNGTVKKDTRRNTVITKMNPSLLKQVAEKTNGIAGHHQNNSSLDEIAARLDAIQKNELDETIFVQYESRFQYFLFPALLLLILETFFSNRKRMKRVKRLTV